MDATKESIMAAAMRLFAEKGLKLVTVREICKAAKVNVALVNYHFRNKNGLYQACVERLFHENTGDELCTIDATVSDARSWRAAVRTRAMSCARSTRPSPTRGPGARPCAAGYSAFRAGCGPPKAEPRWRRVSFDRKCFIHPRCATLCANGMSSPCGTACCGSSRWLSRMFMNSDAGSSRFGRNFPHTRWWTLHGTRFSVPWTSRWMVGAIRLPISSIARSWPA